MEQKCPYLLPGDRAPAHPTQYAGEPTFLCLGTSFIQFQSNLLVTQCPFSADPNIPETGEQKIKSNHGPDNCCYEYCDQTASRKLCARCHWNDTTVDLKNVLEEGPAEAHASPEISAEIEVEATLDYYRDNSYPSEQPVCAAIHVPTSLGISTVRMSVLPNTRCPIPYFIGHAKDRNKDNKLYHETTSDEDSVSSSSASPRTLPTPNLLLVAALWLLYFAGTHCEIFVVYHTCWCLLNTSIRKCRQLLRFEELELWRWWSWSWLRKSSSSSSSLLNLSRFPSITCCRHTQLFRRVNLQIRTLKCQLLLFWKLYLCRNYYYYHHHHHPDRHQHRNLIRRCSGELGWSCYCRRPLAPKPPPTQQPPLPSPPKISPQSLSESRGGAEEQEERRDKGNRRTRSINSGRRINSHAKTVVRWGTIVVAGRRKTYFRIKNYCSRWWSTGAKSFLGLAATKLTSNIITKLIPRTAASARVHPKSLVMLIVDRVSEWLISRIDRYQRLVKGHSRNWSWERWSRRSGLIEKDESWSTRANVSMGLILAT